MSTGSNAAEEEVAAEDNFEDSKAEVECDGHVVGILSAQDREAETQTCGSENEDEAQNYEEMTLKELKALAKTLKLKGYSKLKKLELILRLGNNQVLKYFLELLLKVSI